MFHVPAHKNVAAPAAQVAAKAAAASYAVEVIADNSGKWVANGCRYADEAAAKSAGSDLFARWSLVREWRVVRSSDAPNR